MTHRRITLAPIAAAAVLAATLSAGVSAGLVGVAPTASATVAPAASCQTLHQRMVRAYDVYQEDAHRYGKNSARTQKAYRAYVTAEDRYHSQCG